jgi:hypothetical protein
LGVAARGRGDFTGAADSSASHSPNILSAASTPIRCVAEKGTIATCAA